MEQGTSSAGWRCDHTNVAGSHHAGDQCRQVGAECSTDGKNDWCEQDANSLVVGNVCQNAANDADNDDEHEGTSAFNKWCNDVCNPSSDPRVFRSEWCGNRHGGSKQENNIPRNVLCEQLIECDTAFELASSKEDHSDGQNTNITDVLQYLNARDGSRQQVWNDQKQQDNNKISENKFLIAGQLHFFGSVNFAVGDE